MAEPIKKPAASDFSAEPCSAWVAAVDITKTGAYWVRCGFPLAYDAPIVVKQSDIDNFALGFEGCVSSGRRTSIIKLADWDGLHKWTYQPVAPAVIDFPMQNRGPSSDEAQSTNNPNQH